MEIDEVALRRHGAEGARALLETLCDIYGEVNAEPPYYEDADGIADFRKRTRVQTERPGFELVSAHADEEIAGFAFGFSLPPDTNWWESVVPAPSTEMAEEWEGRTFALVELDVRAPWRRRGVGRALHHTLLADRSEERTTLCASPEAEPAQAAYASWGWRKVGEKPLPLAGNPVYDVLVLPLVAEDEGRRTGTRNVAGS